MLRCISRYRNAALKLYVEPGEVLTELTAEQEAHLLRDSPGSFERVAERPSAKALDAPPQDKMLERESAHRKDGERRPGKPMGREDHPGLLRG